MTHLMMMNPPSAGDDLGIPSSTVAHSHSASFCQGTWRDGVTWSRKTEENIMGNVTSQTDEIKSNSKERLRGHVFYPRGF